MEGLPFRYHYNTGKTERNGENEAPRESAG